MNEASAAQAGRAIDTLRDLEALRAELDVLDALGQLLIDRSRAARTRAILDKAIADIRAITRNTKDESRNE